MVTIAYLVEGELRGKSLKTLPLKQEAIYILQ